jgi:lysophospholipase L1-like esterase
VAGRLAHSLGATSVENYAVSGAVVADLPAQVAAAKQKTYTAILLQIGGNDIIRFHNAERVGRELEQILKTLPAAEKIILMSAGDVGSAHLFPFFVRPFHTALNQKYHRVFERIATAFGAQYVNLYTLPAKDPFVLEPKKYFSLDGLHPSSEGYRVWFERLELGS